MAKSGHPSWFFHYDKVGVEVPNADIILRGRSGSGMWQQTDHVTRLQSTPLIETKIAIDLQTAGGDLSAKLTP